MLVAGYRARASAAGDPIISDPWAARLAGSEGEALTRQFDGPQPHLELWIAVRTAHLDARVRDLTGPRSSIAQVVILGAGLDTRAARLARSTWRCHVRLCVAAGNCFAHGSLCVVG